MVPRRSEIPVDEVREGFQTVRRERQPGCSHCCEWAGAQDVRGCDLGICQYGSEVEDRADSEDVVAVRVGTEGRYDSEVDPD